MYHNFDVPVVLIIYNRCENVSLLLKALRAVKPEHVLVIADGAKDRQSKESVLEARKVIEQIDWDCRIDKCYAEENMGCDRRIITGLNWVFSLVERAIILEDDCIPNQSFFMFCREMLEKYAGDERIMYISGSNSAPITGKSDSYAFSKRGDTWGWATWRRAWKQMPKDFVSEWTRIKEKKLLQKYRGYGRAASFIREVEGHDVSHCPWDYQWLTLVQSRGGLAVVPKYNLISNIGFTEEATHTKTCPEGYSSATRELEMPMVHPKTVFIDKKYDSKKYRMVYANGILIRGFRKMKRILRGWVQ